MSVLTETFGAMVFTDAEMKRRLSPGVYKKMHDMGSASEWDRELADEVADAMYAWATEKGATHYTHWFTPMTGISAGKHTAFLHSVKNSEPICRFSGSTLIKGESDASSFPSGGLRSTFEARGYTAWDPSSPAFIVGTVLYIPTAFCSYTGEALDQKTPLLRSMQAVNTQAVRMLRLLGDQETQSVMPSVGTEQEYFLLDRTLYEKRPDLQLCGRTLFGARPPKGQELGDHYYGRIRTRVLSFMEELDETLWSLGIPSFARHNEAAPAQHECAVIYSTVNVACDHNQLLMQVIRNISRKHGFYCLLHEKPYGGISGSGKHNNWSLATDRGVNLLSPSENPAEDLRFLVFLCAVLTAVDNHADLIRLSAASAGNDHRLGGHEAPPAIISVFLGSHLASVLSDYAEGSIHHDSFKEQLLSDIALLPTLESDDTDRNRTSPFAFTGNKFEFRMVGSSQSVGLPNTVINTAVADALDEMCTRIEASENRTGAIQAEIARCVREHGRIIFNGNNYSEEWRKEAEQRGLPCYKDTVSAIPVLLKPENIALFQRMKVLSESECRSRYEIMLDNYCSVASIELETMCEMTRREILPACLEYAGQLAKDLSYLTKCDIMSKTNREITVKLCGLADKISDSLELIHKRTQEASAVSDLLMRAKHYRDLLHSEAALLRKLCDEAEQIVPSSRWPFPSYTELLYNQ